MQQNDLLVGGGVSLPDVDDETSSDSSVEFTLASQMAIVCEEMHRTFEFVDGKWRLFPVEKRRWNISCSTNAASVTAATTNQLNGKICCWLQR